MFSLQIIFWAYEAKISHKRICLFLTNTDAHTLTHCAVVIFVKFQESKQSFRFVINTTETLLKLNHYFVDVLLR